MSKAVYNVIKLCGLSGVLNSPNRSVRVGYTLMTTGTKKWGRSDALSKADINIGADFACNKYYRNKAQQK